MNWDWIFSAANVWAMIAWAVLILLPRGEILRTLTFYLGVGLLCFLYAFLLLGLLAGWFDAGGGEAGEFTTIEGVRNIFSSDGGVTVGWVHYLAFDLFAGMWIARDADSKGFSRILQAPILLLTFVAGPAGLLVWFFLREPAARRAARRKKG